MIIVTELAFNDEGHVPFNAGLLAVVHTAFPDRRLCFFGAPGHIDGLKQQCGKALMEAMEWREVCPLAPDLPYFTRLFKEIKRLRKMLVCFSQGAGGLLIITNAKPAALVALKLIKQLQYKQLGVHIVLHGQLGGIIGKRHRHPVRRVQETRTALTIFGNHHLQYLVLEENLRDVLMKHLPALSGKVEVLEHPLPPNEIEGKVIPFGNPVRFGFLGLANEAKGFSVFVKLARDVNVKYKSQTEFHAIGRLSSEEKATLPLEALTTKPGMTRLSRVDYVQGVERLHFIMFPHQPSCYELNSSGTLLDALAWGKPLIARRIAIFENFFYKHGDMGYLFSTDRELQEIVERIVEGADKAHYQRQVLNIQKARWSRTPEVLAAKYRKICDDFLSYNLLAPHGCVL